MAQNVRIAGASYSDVPAVDIPKTGGGTARFVDTSDANAAAGDIADGKTAYVNGAKVTGTATGGASIHNDLTGRDAADAHPISAITGLASGLEEKANLSGGNTFSGNQIFNDLVYLEGSTPFFMSKQGKIGMRATNAANENLGQINISNSFDGFDPSQYGLNLNVLNGLTNKRNTLRLSHEGVKFKGEDDVWHNIALEDEVAAALAQKQNALTPGDGLSIANNVISLDLDNYDGGAF